MMWKFGLLLVLIAGVLSQRPPPPGSGPPPPPGGGSSSQNTCSSNIASFNTPVDESASCEGFSFGNSYTYPDDFSILNYHQWYECNTSGYRILVSNDIPNHDIEVNNPNDVCMCDLKPKFSSFFCLICELKLKVKLFGMFASQ
jgi:hypothetical protein